jgi:hypothetical protein
MVVAPATRRGRRAIMARIRPRQAGACHSHFIHLKNTNGNTPDISIKLSAMG